MYLKVLLIVFLIGHVHLQKKAKKPVTCKKTHIDKLDTSLSTQLSDLKSETQNCCTTNEEQIEEVNDQVKDVNDEVEEVNDKVDEMKADVALIKDHLKRIDDNLQCKPEVTLPHDCSDDTSFIGAKIIQPQGLNPFRVYCSGGCVYMARRFDGSVDFYRGWTEYQRGFGSPLGEHFIGLDKLNGILYQGNYRLRVDLTMWPPQSETHHAEYSIFDISDEHDNYRLTIGGFRGTLGDSLAVHNGMAFSTKDRDHDTASSNCAVTFKGAWWYEACHHSNLFGFYSKNATCPAYAECMAWFHWPNKIGTPSNYHYSFKKVDMKVCPKY